jgi:hypothetical protein
MPVDRTVVARYFGGRRFMQGHRPVGESAALPHERYRMKILALVAVLVALVLPASASATVVASSTPGCVVVTLDGVDIGDKPVTVRFKSPSGGGGGILRNWNPGEYPMTFCVAPAVYAAAGYGWTATASAGGVSLGSTVF